MVVYFSFLLLCNKRVQNLGLDISIQFAHDFVGQEFRKDSAIWFISAECVVRQGDRGWRLHLQGGIFAHVWCALAPLSHSQLLSVSLFHYMVSHPSESFHVTWTSYSMVMSGQSLGLKRQEASNSYLRVIPAHGTESVLYSIGQTDTRPTRFKRIEK